MYTDSVVICPTVDVMVCFLVQVPIQSDKYWGYYVEETILTVLVKAQ